MLNTPILISRHNSGSCHHSQVANTKMTIATKMLDKINMIKRTYSRDELLQMVAEIKTATDWSVDRIARECGFKEHKLKDWKRRGKRIDSQYGDIVKAQYDKIVGSKLAGNIEKSRLQLNAAIEKWFKEEDEALIIPLASSAYKGILVAAVERKASLPFEADIPDEQKNSIPYIFCSIASLNILGEPLNVTEVLFLWWLTKREQKFLTHEAGEKIIEFFPINDKTITRSDFFRLLMRGNISTKEA